ncbi:MAG TPA: serine hydrolase [Leptolyngbyaceae cyanobacterium]
MAASEKGNSRRQRRQRQLKQQPVPEQQEVARIRTEQPELPKSKAARAGIPPAPDSRLPSNFGKSQPQRRQTLTWWQRLFGQNTTKPAKRRSEKASPLPTGKISSSLPRQIKPERKNRLNSITSARLSSKSPLIPPPSQLTRNGRIREIPAFEIENLPAKPTKNPNGKVGQDKLVPLYPQTGRQSLAQQRRQRPQERKPAEVRASRNGIDKRRKPPSRVNKEISALKPLPHQRQNSISRPSLPPKRKTAASPLLYGTRLLILGIGLGVVVGTMLSIWNPADHKPSAVPGTVNSSQPRSAVADINLPSESTFADLPGGLKLTEEILPLKNAIQSLVNQYPELTPGIFVTDIDTGAYLDFNSTADFASASTIKIPILIAFFQDVDAGKVRLDELLTLDEGSIASGSGKMQYKKAGTKYTALETATEMIINSDNSATNIIVSRLGGAEALNQRFREWGLTNTTIRNPLPDIEGTNTTNPKELASLLARLNQGELVSLASRDRMLGIMQRTVNRTLLPRGLGKGSTIAHKTGNIGSLIGDVGLIDLPSGKRYVAAVLVKRPRNDQKAVELINKLSRLVYEHFSRPASSRLLPSENSSDKG